MYLLTYLLMCQFRYKLILKKNDTRETDRETNTVRRLLRCVNVSSCILLTSLPVKSRWRNVLSPSNACLDTDLISLTVRTRRDNEVRPMNIGEDSSNTDDNLLSFNSLCTHTAHEHNNL